MADTVTIGMGGQVATAHPDYVKAMPKWRRIRQVVHNDCKSQLRNVGRNEPDWNANNPGPRAAERQREYEEGATLYNFTRRTKEGMVGSQFHKAPSVNLPPQLEYLLEDADGNGVGLIQQCKDQCSENVEVSRGFLLADMPDTKGRTRKDQNDGLLNPKILPYAAESIINWRVRRIGAVNKLVMVVLYESYEYISESNEFQYEQGDQYRVLDIDSDGYYRQRVWRYNVDGAENDYEEFEPRMNGSRISYIPGCFFGAQNNDYTIDDAILGPIADLNIDHYRNSADNAEASFIAGQPTLFIYPGENISFEQFQEANPHGIRLGSRSGHNLGSGGGAELIQANETTIHRKNMEAAEEQAMKIGAQMISPSQNITAESARIQRSADTSVIGISSQNISAAYEQALGYCAGYLGIGDSDIEFRLSDELSTTTMTPQERTAWINDINMGVLPRTEYYAALRRAGMTDKTDEELEDAIVNQPVVGMAGDVITDDGDEQQ